MKQLTLNFQTGSEPTGEMTMSSSRADFLANRSQQQESETDETTTATSGRKCFELYGRFSPLGLLVKTLLGSSRWTAGLYSRKYALVWKEKVTPYKRFVFQLSPKERPTEETGYGLLATPNTMDAMDPKTDKAALKEMTQTRPGRTKWSNLRDQIYRGIEMNPKTIGVLPTPQSRDFRSPDNPESGNYKRKMEEGYTIDLNSRIAMLLPTPRAGKISGKAGVDSEGREFRKPVNQIIEECGTTTGSTLRLQPAMCEWMMGFPEGHTKLTFQKIETTWIEI